MRASRAWLSEGSSRPERGRMRIEPSSLLTNPRTVRIGSTLLAIREKVPMDTHAPVRVHPRVFERHPDLTAEEVLSAWEGTLRWVARTRSVFDETVAVGISRGGRTLEMVGVFQRDGSWLIYHAMCPPTAGTLREVGLR